MRNQLEEHQKTLVDSQRRLKHWEDKLSKLSLQNVRYEHHQSGLSNALM